MSIQDDKNRIDSEIKAKKDEADIQGVKDRQYIADQEADRIRQEAERKAQEVQNNAQN